MLNDCDVVRSQTVYVRRMHLNIYDIDSTDAALGGEETAGAGRNTKASPKHSYRSRDNEARAAESGAIYARQLTQNQHLSVPQTKMYVHYLNIRILFNTMITLFLVIDIEPKNNHQFGTVLCYFISKIIRIVLKAFVV